jgi:hypothetical protein
LNRECSEYVFLGKNAGCGEVTLGETVTGGAGYPEPSWRQATKASTFNRDHIAMVNFPANGKKLQTKININ